MAAGAGARIRSPLDHRIFIDRPEPI